MNFFNKLSLLDNKLNKWAEKLKTIIFELFNVHLWGQLWCLITMFLLSIKTLTS